jgi:hypothetical protein
LALVALAVVACSGTSDDLPPGAQAAGPTGCASGELTETNGACTSAGVAPSACAHGFEPDGHGGCNATLPPMPCAKGTMAVPGESACREVAPCGTGTWGSIPLEASTVFVDAAFVGTSDGTQSKPFTKIADAISAAPPGAIVAIAAGSYLGDLLVQGKAVRLWGVCPGKVEIVGTGATFAALSINKAEAGVEVHDVAIRGPKDGVLTSGSKGTVMLDRVWIHDTNDRGVDAEGALGATALTLSRSLVESTVWFGVYVGGADVTIDASVVRGVQPKADGTRGLGLNAVYEANFAKRSTVTVRGSLFEQNHDHGISVLGADAVIEGSVVRGTQPVAKDKSAGRGIAVLDHPTVKQRGNLVLRGSIVENNYDIGVFAWGSEVLIENSVVRRTLPRVSDGRGGRGVDIQFHPQTKEGTVATLRGALIDDSREVGIHIAGSSVSAERVVVRNTQASSVSKIGGRGINAQPDGGIPTNLSLKACVVEQSLEGGIVVIASNATLESLLVRDTAPRASDGRLGDGIAVISEGGAAKATVTRSRIANSARAGITSFGAAFALGASTMECNQIQLNGEMFQTFSAAFTNLGANTCGCMGATSPCAVLSSSLEPPGSAP